MEKKTVGYTDSAKYRCLEDLQQISSMSAVNPLNLDYCGIEQCEPGHAFGPYMRENYVVHIILSGSGQVRLQDRCYQLSKGEAFIIFPGDHDVIYQADGEKPWEYMWIGFHGYVAERVIRCIGATRENPLIQLRDTDVLQKEIEKMLEARRPVFVDELKRASALYAAVGILIEENPAHEEVEDCQDTDYVKQAVGMIMRLYAKNLRISEIAATIGISRSHLTNLFKQEYQMSPQGFLMNVRMEKAARLLVETDDPIQAIGISVGYADALSFSKAFKQKYGVSPSAYRACPVEVVEISQKGGYVGKYHL